ncbi:MAG: matrixin family metalloprotease [Chlamydiales bacterium]|nr:matrixin family metalloprotease [Chlamydiales bacterium]
MIIKRKAGLYFASLLCLLAVSITSPLSAYTVGSPEVSKWGSTASYGLPGGTVTWSVMPAGVNITEGGTTWSNAPLDSFMGTFQSLTLGDIKGEITRAFDTWASVANINFVEVPDGGGNFPGGLEAMIRFGGHPIGVGDAVLAHGYYPPGTNSLNFAGDIHFSTNVQWEAGDLFGSAAYDIYTLALHEIGHAIGLRHETIQTSVMRELFSTSDVLTGLYADDIAGAQYIYGVRVPEPETYAIMGGFLALALYIGHRRRLNILNERCPKLITRNDR